MAYLSLANSLSELIITNRSFIDGKTFDGFRKTFSQKIDRIDIADLGSDIRSGDTTGNVFDIKTGVAIIFLVKQPKK